MTNDHHGSMLLKACVNGARSPEAHPALPVTAIELAADVEAVAGAGAGAVHLHVKDDEGSDTFDDRRLADVLTAVRASCPGLPIGVTTGAWALPDPRERVAAIRSWTVVPDFASVNWHEDGAEDVARALLDRGVGVEAGLWHGEAVAAWLASPYRDRTCRVLLELSDGLDVSGTAAEADRLLNQLRGDGRQTTVPHGKRPAAGFPSCYTGRGPVAGRHCGSRPPSASTRVSGSRTRWSCRTGPGARQRRTGRPRPAADRHLSPTPMSGRLQRRQWGAGPRTALLLHGSTSSSMTWWYVAQLLADRGWTVVALDLPSHGGSPAAARPLVPTIAADAVESELIGSNGGPDIRRVEVLAGHSFGAAVAVALAARGVVSCRRLFLEELPGPHSVAWAQEAQGVVTGGIDARNARADVVAQIRQDQPFWTVEDCRYAVDDLASCHIDSIASGLQEGATWTPRPAMRQLDVPVALLMAPDAPGINTLEDATALRGRDRSNAVADLRARITVLDGGHCLHRDRPHEWTKFFTDTGSGDEGHH